MHAHTAHLKRWACNNFGAVLSIKERSFYDSSKKGNKWFNRDLLNKISTNQGRLIFSPFKLRPKVKESE